MKKGIYIIIIIISIYIITCGVIALNNKSKDVYITDNEFLYDIAKEYLINHEKETSHDKDMPNFNSFIAYKGFGIQENLDKAEKYAYMWILQENYYVLNHQLCSSTGSSIAYKFTLKDDKVVKYDIPEDGSYYTSSMKKIFPSDIYNKMISYDSSSSGELGKDIQEQIKEYYKGIDVSQKNNVVGTTFEGIIERNDTNNKTLYIQGFQDNDINYKGEFILRISDKTNIGYNSQVLKQEDLNRGDTIRIVFSGSILESYPGQIEEVLFIIKYDSDKLVLLDAPHKSSGFVYEISKEDKEEIYHMINESTFGSDTCEKIAEYTFKLNDIEYGIEILANEIHMIKNNEEAKLSEDNRQKMQSILSNYIPHNDETEETNIATTATLNGITYHLKPKYTRRNNQIERGYYIDTLNQPNSPYWLIICSGQRNTGGYSIDISNIEIDENQNCKITVRENVPLEGEVVTQVITYPTCVLELSKLPTSISIQNEHKDLFNYIQ